jgi:hypothetical protein
MKTISKTILSLAVAGLFALLFATAVVGLGARNASFLNVDSSNIGSLLGMAG